MKKSYQMNTDEPVGIVISRGPRAEPTPRFSSYVWESIPANELSAALDSLSRAA